MILSGYRKSLEDLVNETYLRADDPGRERFSISSVIRAINEATLELALAAQIIVAAVPVHLEENKWVFDLNNVNASYASKERDYGFFLRAEYVDDADDAVIPGPGRYGALFPKSHKGIDLSGWKHSETNRPEAVHKDMLSPNKIALFPIPSADGEDLSTSIEGNLLVWFVGLPDPMSGDTEAARRASYPDDQILAQFHRAIPPGAAARLLDEGDLEDLALAEEQDSEFYAMTMEAAADQARGATRYEGFTPI